MKQRLKEISMRCAAFVVRNLVKFRTIIAYVTFMWLWFMNRTSLLPSYQIHKHKDKILIERKCYNWKTSSYFVHLRIQDNNKPITTASMFSILRNPPIECHRYMMNACYYWKRSNSDDLFVCRISDDQIQTNVVNAYNSHIRLRDLEAFNWFVRPVTTLSNPSINNTNMDMKHIEKNEEHDDDDEEENNLQLVKLKIQKVLTQEKIMMNEGGIVFPYSRRLRPLIVEY